MGKAIDVVLFVIGVAMVLVAMASAINATVLPRAVQNRLVTLVVVSMRLIFGVFLRHAATYERRDRVMAFFGPATLIAELATWMTLLVVGYSMMFLGIETSSVERAVELSGSSVTTIGTSASVHLATQLLTYSEAGLGLVLLTLLITYLPSIYQSFSRRENGVSLLAVRAGSPPRATTMLIRYHRIEDVSYRLTELWRTWESWFVDVEETHSSYPILASFRSPHSDQSWVNAAGVLLDGASLWVSTVEHPIDPDANYAYELGSSRCGGSPPASGFLMPPIRPLTTPFQFCGPSSSPPTTRWPMPASPSSRIGSRHGSPFPAGASITTRCCSIWPGSSKLHLFPGSRTAVHYGLTRSTRFDRQPPQGWRERPRGPNGAAVLGGSHRHPTPAMTRRLLSITRRRELRSPKEAHSSQSQLRVLLP